MEKFVVSYETDHIHRVEVGVAPIHRPGRRSLLLVVKIRRNLAADELVLWRRQRARKGPLVFWKGRGVSERWFVAVGLCEIIVWHGHPLLSIVVVKRHLVMRPDAFTEIVEQFDDGLRLLWRPVGRDKER